MSAPVAWWWPALVALFTALAVAGASNPGVAVPAAAAAVMTAALAVGVSLNRAASARTAPAPRRPVPRSGVRDWIAAGELGREDLLLLLDRLERKSLNPTLPARTPQEVGMIVNLPPREFRRYVAGRLDTLEGTV